MPCSAGGERALLIAAREGRDDLVKLLVEIGNAHLDTRYAEEKTCLHWAIISQMPGYLEVVKILLKLGADHEAKDAVSLKCETLTHPPTDLHIMCTRMCGLKRFTHDIVWASLSAAVPQRPAPECMQSPRIH